MKKGDKTVGDHVKNLLAAGIDPTNHNATTPKKMWQTLMTQPPAPPQASGVESPAAWAVTRAAHAHGFEAGQKSAGPPPPPLELPPPLEVPTPADEDDGAVLAVRLPIDLGAMGKLAGVMASIHGTVPLQVDTVGGWAVFKIKKA